MASTLSAKTAAHREFSGVEPCFRRNRASGRFWPREIAYQSGGCLEHALDEGGRVDVEACVEQAARQRKRAAARLRIRGEAAEEVERAATAVVGDPDQLGRGLEERGDRVHVEGLDGLEEPSLAHVVSGPPPAVSRYCAGPRRCR
jgi:hypothetical protein